MSRRLRKARVQKSLPSANSRELFGNPELEQFKTPKQLYRSTGRDCHTGTHSLTLKRQAVEVDASRGQGQRSCQPEHSSTCYSTSIIAIFTATDLSSEQRQIRRNLPRRSPPADPLGPSRGWPNRSRPMPNVPPQGRSRR